MPTTVTMIIISTTEVPLLVCIFSILCILSIVGVYINRENLQRSPLAIFPLYQKYGFGLNQAKLVVATQTKSSRG